MDMVEAPQGKDCHDVQVQEHHLVLTGHVHLVPDLIHQAIQGLLFPHGPKILALEVDFILLGADLLHLSVLEDLPDVMLGDVIPLLEEAVNHAQYHVLLEDPLTLQGLLLRPQTFLPPKYQVHLRVPQIRN